jgi:DNA/RNA-binding domain of Phe-tRNA-synthetase-like protein
VLTVDPHPSLDVIAFTTHFPSALGALGAQPQLAALLAPGAPAPLHSDEETRGRVRDLLRHGGYKPTGRGKPASEYLVRAVAEGALASINAAVDACNVASLHSGLPISVVDLAFARAPFRVGLPAPGTTYVFNASGQSIDVGGLLCLFDADGPCANPVKDSQRTKTSGQTVATLSVLWGTHALPGRTAATFTWYAQLLTALGARVERLPTSTDGG